MRAAFGFGFGLPLGGGEDSPAIDWNFASGVMPSALTFSRASLATMYDSSGALVWCPHNLLTYSEQIDNAAWSKSGGTTVTPNSTSDPNGGATADTVAFATTGEYAFNQYSTPSALQNYVFSIWLRAASPTTVNVVLQQSGGAQSSTTASVDTTWQRVQVSYTTDGAPTFLRASLFPNANTPTFYAWGAQLNVGTLQPYYPTTSAAYYGPRLTYDPATLQPLGLLVEEQRTNLLLNSLLDGTNLSTQSVTVAATQYTLSFYGTGQIVLSGSATATVVGTGAFPTQKTYTFTPSAGSLTLTVTGTVQFAQLEAGAFATSYIPTGAASATRAADVVTCTGAAFSQWFNATEGTFVAEYQPLAAGVGCDLFMAHSGAPMTNSIGMYYDLSNHDVGWCRVAGVTQAAAAAVIANAAAHKAAFGYAVNDFALCSAGGAIASDTTGSPPSPDRLTVGANSIASSTQAMTIKRIRYWRKRLTNAQLQALTA